MKKKTSLLFLLVAGCAGAPVSYNAVAPPGDDGDLYTCSMQQLSAMGYIVDDLDRESGFIRARKQTSGTARFLFAGEAKHSALIVSIFEEVGGDGQVMRVTAGTITEDTWGIGRGAESMGTPSMDTTNEAQQILVECTGNVGVVDAA